MLLPVLATLCLANASKCQLSEPNRTTPSTSDPFRTGAIMVSRFLNPNSHQGFSFIFNRLRDNIKVDFPKKKKDSVKEFILFVLRLMGVDNQKITDFAFDGIISLLYLMNQVLIENVKRIRKKKTEFSLFRFILEQSQVGSLFTQMRDPKLVDLVLKESEEKLKTYPKNKVDCIKLLICRTKPFVQEMQRSLGFFTSRENIESSEKKTCERRNHKEFCKEKNKDVFWEKTNLEDRMYFFVPSLKEVIEWGDECDQLFSNCIY